MAGFVPKFQPSMTKIVGGVCVQRNKMATILYMYRCYVQMVKLWLSFKFDLIWSTLKQENCIKPTFIPKSWFNAIFTAHG